MACSTAKRRELCAMSPALSIPVVPTHFSSTRYMRSLHCHARTRRRSRYQLPGSPAPLKRGYPRSPAVFKGRPYRASRPGRPRMDILSIRPLDSRSARRCAKGSRSRKRRRVAPERLTGGTGTSRRARRGRMPLRAVVTKRQAARVAPRLRGAKVSGTGFPWHTAELQGSK